MTKTLNSILLAGLMLSCIGTAHAAPTKNQPTQTKVAQSQQKIKGWSFKAKVAAALGVVATCIGIYIAYKLKTSPSDLDKMVEYEMQQFAQNERIPTGNAGILMLNLQAHTDYFQQAMRNPVSRANIEQLFNNQDFAAFMECRLNHIFTQLLTEIFNDHAILELSTRNNFVEMTLEALNRRWVFANS